MGRSIIFDRDQAPEERGLGAAIIATGRDFGGANRIADRGRYLKALGLYRNDTEEIGFFSGDRFELFAFGSGGATDGENRQRKRYEEGSDFGELHSAG